MGDSCIYKFLEFDCYYPRGESKVWYGVPDSGAQDLEQIIREEAPELFTKEPSLMHQLVTTISPKKLKDKGVPVS